MFRTIKVKLTVVVFAILFAMFMVQIASNFLFAEKFYINSKSKMITEAFDSLKNISKKDDEEMVKVINQYEDLYNLQFIVSNSELICIYNSKQYNFPVKGNRYRIRPGYSINKNISLFSREAKPVIKVTKDKNEALTLYGILERENSVYYVVIKSHIKSIMQDMKETNRLILNLSLFALAVGAVVAYFFAKRVSAPIVEIEEVARNVSKLDFSKKVRSNLPDDEIGQLAGSINRMSEELEGTIEELLKENEYKARIDEMRKEFIANVSHELKTPLAILSGYAELLNSNIEGLDIEYYYSVILDETSRMTTLVNNLMNLSKVENSMISLTIKEINISELISQLIEKNQVLFQKKNLKCLFAKEEVYYAMADCVYIELAIGNYLSNAISHTKEGGTIYVSIKKIEQKDRIRIGVFNEGEHIKEEDLKKIWDSFYRGDKSRTRTLENRVGLGLYIVSEIINMHHGEYGAENKEDGVEFYIQLNCSRKGSTE